MGDIIKGNLEDKNIPETHKGWSIGHFIEEGSPFKNDNFELKWAVHSAGWKKSNVGMTKEAKTMAILIDGKFVFRFPEEKEEVELIEKGDYVFWDAKVHYSSEALEDTTILIIRWPSLAGDKVYIS